LFTKKTCGQQQVNFLAAISHINDIYSILNNRLKMKSTIQVEEDGDGGRGRQQHQQQQPLFLLGTPYPTNVDAVLFAHLAEALTDVHVLPILSQYETLMDFFQIIFHTYFGPNYRFPPSSPNEEVDHVCMEELVKRNNATNYRNASGTHVYNSIQVDAASILRLHLNKNSLWDAATVQQQQYDHFNGGGKLYTAGLWTVVFSQKVMMKHSMVLHLSIGDNSSNQKKMMKQRRTTTERPAMKRHPIRNRDKTMIYYG